MKSDWLETDVNSYRVELLSSADAKSVLVVLRDDGTASDRKLPAGGALRTTVSKLTSGLQE